jgi:hypothetical protein
MLLVDSQSWTGTGEKEHSKVIRMPRPNHGCRCPVRRSSIGLEVVRWRVSGRFDLVDRCAFGESMKVDLLDWKGRRDDPVAGLDRFQTCDSS